MWAIAPLIVIAAGVAVIIIAATRKRTERDLSMRYENPPGKPMSGTTLVLITLGVIALLVIVGLVWFASSFGMTTQ